MKKFLGIVLAFVICVFLAACAENKTAEQPSAPKNSTEVTKPNENEKGKSLITQVHLGEEFLIGGGEYAVTINSLRKVEDDEGNPAVVVNYSFTNKTMESTSTLFALLIQVFQDDKELDPALVMEGVHYEHSGKEIKPQETLQDCEEAFVMTSENKLQIEITSMRDVITGKKAVIEVDAPK